MDTRARDCTGGSAGGEVVALLVRLWVSVDGDVSVSTFLAVASVCRVTVCALTVDSGDVSVSPSKPDVACQSVVGGFDEEEADSSASSIDDAVELECGGSDEAGDFVDGPVADPESADPDVEDDACEPDD